MLHKVLVVDDTPVLSDMLTRMLGDHCAVGWCGTGEDVLEELLRFVPDVLVLDLTSERLNGLQLLSIARQMGLKCRVLVVVRYVSDYVVQRMDRLGVSHVFVKPCSVGALRDRVLELCCWSAPWMDETRANTHAMLLELGLRSDLKGYGYVLEAILYAYEHPGCSMMKDVYPQVALRCGGSPAQTEHIIRITIAKARLCRNNALWKGLFPALGSGKKTLSNRQFIHRLSAALMTRAEQPMEKQG